MNKKQEIQEIVTAEDGEKMIRYTLLGERWYVKNDVFYPSLTWILSKYPKGEGFLRWVVENGLKNSKEITEEKGNKGSMVHSLCERLTLGESITATEQYIDPLTKKVRPLTREEWTCLCSFVKFYKSAKIRKVLSVEKSYFNEKYHFACTADLIYEDYDGNIVVVDLKTSANVYNTHTAQVAAIMNTLILAGRKNVIGAIVLLGYEKNKQGFRVHTVDYDASMKIFEAAHTIFYIEEANTSPKITTKSLTLHI